jgi:hypothetical protein
MKIWEIFKVEIILQAKNSGLLILKSYVIQAFENILRGDLR